MTKPIRNGIPNPFLTPRFDPPYFPGPPYFPKNVTAGIRREAESDDPTIMESHTEGYQNGYLEGQFRMKARIIDALDKSSEDFSRVVEMIQSVKIK